MSNKIGIGVITCNRPNFFKELIDSIPEVDSIIVINDGKPYDNSIYPSKVGQIIQHKKNKKIGKSKNEALKFLLEKECKHIFLLEDDIAILNQEIFEKYIYASEVSGIWHLNYAYHILNNRDSDGRPIPKKIVEYDKLRIALYKYATAALTYFRNDVLNTVGLIDEFYWNVHEHVDHTYRIIKAGYHPPFGWFADLADSFNYIKELDLHQTQSINTRNGISFKLRALFFEYYFMLKFGKTPAKIPESSEEEVLKILEEFKKNRSSIRR